MCSITDSPSRLPPQRSHYRGTQAQPNRPSPIAAHPVTAGTVRGWDSDELYACLAKVEHPPLRKQATIDIFLQAEIAGDVLLMVTEKWFVERCGLAAAVAKSFGISGP